MINNKKILVVGLGKSGMAMLKVLNKLGNEVHVYDGKEKHLIDNIDEIKTLSSKQFFNEIPSINEYDILALSPGVSTELDFIKKAREYGVVIWGEIEIAYQLSNGDFIGITGTNGKTTTTSLIYDIFKNYFNNVQLVGNIGIPAIEKVIDTDGEQIFVAEISSFQLETIETFKTKIAVILNVTEDHLDRHKTMKNYIEVKFRIFENIDDDGYIVLNYDDELLRRIDSKKGKTFFFSRKEILDKGCYVKDGDILINDGKKIVNIMKTDEIFILGNHNVENVLAAVSVAHLYSIPINIIKDTIINFKGVEHRLEVFENKFERVFINDSKGTNPDATIKAIEAMEAPTVLIAGGMDKKADFKDMIECFKDKIKYLVLFGETKDIIKKTATDLGFNNVVIVDNLEQAVIKAVEVSDKGYNVLLSPACASWDMYENFEVRGNHFKRIVEKLG